jgi:hypothetical protein
MGYFTAFKNEINTNIIGVRGKRGKRKKEKELRRRTRGQVQRSNEGKRTN